MILSSSSDVTSAGFVYVNLAHHNLHRGINFAKITTHLHFEVCCLCEPFTVFQNNPNSSPEAVNPCNSSNQNDVGKTSCKHDTTNKLIDKVLDETLEGIMVKLDSVDVHSCVDDYPIIVSNDVTPTNHMLA